MWEKRPGPAADVHPGGALSTAGLGEHRVHQRTRLPAPPTGQGQGRHEVLQERHEDQRHQCPVSHRSVIVLLFVVCKPVTFCFSINC